MGQEMTISNHDHVAGSGEKEKSPAQDRRESLQKPLKDNTNEEEAGKVEEVVGKNEKVSTIRKEIATEEVKIKRKCNLYINEKLDSVTEEIGNVTGSSTDDFTKIKGFRPVGSRRKGKPRRAAGVFEW